MIITWKQSCLFSDNVKLSRDGSTITIVKVQPDNHGTYRCVASNPFGITHTIVSLIVKGKDRNKFTDFPPPLTEEPPLVAEPCSCFCVRVLRLSDGRRHPCRACTGQGG